MLSFSRITYLLSALAGISQSVYFDIGCNQGTQSQDIKDAVDDVVAVATVVTAALLSGTINGKQDVFRAAYDPLMLPADQAGLAAIFGKLALIKTSPTPNVQIYCRENHIHYNRDDPTRFWEDRDYFSNPNSQYMRVYIDKNSPLKPGTKGSYTTHGFKHDDELDTFGQAHIFIAPTRLSPPAKTDRDLRRYTEIVANGPDGIHYKIEAIKPLAQTVMHELLHAVGGISGPDPKTKQIVHLIHDGPRNAKVYGWAACNARRINNEKNSDLADCLTFLAQAIYLQFQDRDTFWTTGEVDPTIFGPVHIP